MAEPEQEPKHPYVTQQNGKVHLVFSVITIIMSLVQIILGIVISEKQVKEIAYDMNGKSKDRYNRDDLDELFHGDHVWVGFVGLTLAVLGLSVWHTRARANGIMLSLMLFLAGFLIYPVAAALGGGFKGDSNSQSPYIDSIINLRVGSCIYTALQAIVIISWAFYTSFHACCNSKVRKQTRLNLPGGQTVMQAPTAQPQVVYVQQPGQQFVGGQQPVQYVGAPQPVQFVGGQQPVQFVGGQQPVYVVQGPPQYVQQAQVPVQVQHGPPPPDQGPDYSPPSYAE